VIEPARVHDIARLQSIEDAAGEAFRALGMDTVADDDPPSEATLTEFIRTGRAWVYTQSGVVCGYLIAFDVDDCTHIEQVSVDPDYSGRGIGAALIEHLESVARERHRVALTLTTYRDVPWNGPYYSRLGFVEDPDPSPALLAIRAHEAELGLDAWPRIVMRRAIARSDPSAPAPVR